MCGTEKRQTVCCLEGGGGGYHCVLCSEILTSSYFLQSVRRMHAWLLYSMREYNSLNEWRMLVVLYRKETNSLLFRGGYHCVVGWMQYAVRGRITVYWMEDVSGAVQRWLAVFCAEYWKTYIQSSPSQHSETGKLRKHARSRLLKGLIFRRIQL